MQTLQKLRLKTHDVHERLHHHPITSPLVSQTLSIQQYQLSLMAFEKFYKALAAQIPSDYVKNLALECLSQDIKDAGIEHNPLPACIMPACILNHNCVLGVMYVVEGSHLGGQMIAKNVRKTLGFNQEYGASFFSGHGKKTAMHWKGFLEKLDQECDDIDRCIWAAEKTFSSLEDWLWSAWDYKEENYQQKKRGTA